LLQGVFEHLEADGSYIVDTEPCTCTNWLLRLGLEHLRTILYIIGNEPAGVRDASNVIVRPWVTLESPWDHLRISLESLWNHFGISLGSICGRSGVTFGPLRTNFEVTLGVL
jgi:hypothetical protein